MAMTGVLRPGMVQLRVLDMNKALTHYIDKLGLIGVCRASDRRVFLKAEGEFEHHSLILRQSDRPGVDLIGLRVEETRLSELKEKTKDFGLPCKEISAKSDQPGVGQRLAVILPSGHRLDFYAEMEVPQWHPELHNPALFVGGGHLGLLGLDHVMLSGPSAEETVRYCEKVLEMEISETVKMLDGVENFCTWLTCGEKACDLAIFRQDTPGGLHHIGYRLENPVMYAGDVLAVKGLSLETGPVRHGATGHCGIYHKDPSGNRIELCAPGRVQGGEMPVRVWDHDQLGRAFNYHTGSIPEGFLIGT